MINEARLLTDPRFWAIFWIDASSQATAEQGFLEIARVCGIERKLKVVRQWLSNTQNSWLLIIDNADDPAMDVSEFFPTGSRGCILLTTRNPDCKIHATVGSYELEEMELGDAVTLLLRASGVEDATADIVREKAAPIATTLGCLALAIVQAGAYIRNGFCSIDEYCDIYSSHRERLLRHLPVQKRSDYKYSVYTTWEVSIEAVERLSSEASVNAIELIRIFCFLHYDKITEDIFERAWKNSHNGEASFKNIANLFYMRSQEGLAKWDPIMIREAAVLLASFSLIKIDGVGPYMSMHPLVHVWARDRLSEEMQNHYWAMASSTLAASIPWGFQLSDYRFRQSLVPHIDSCIFLCKDKPFLSSHSGMDRADMAAGFARTFLENGRLQSAVELGEKELQVRQKTLGNEHPDSLIAMNNLAISYSDLGHRQEAMELREKVLEASQRTLGSEHPDTLGTMDNLANSYSYLGRRQEAMELREKVLEARQRTLGSEHPDTLTTMNNLANSYSDLGHRQEAMELREKVLEARQRTLGSEHPDTLGTMDNLAISYSDLGHRQEAIELLEKASEAMERTLGSEHPDTLRVMNNLAIIRSRLTNVGEWRLRRHEETQCI
jgi:tetratricopeptide (TPR) repeat protein